MSMEIPSNIERDIQRFAQEQHITHDEAVLRLIETGLSARKPVVPKTVFEQGLDSYVFNRKQKYFNKSQAASSS
jgi:hypothetical protein